jgi:hypothetical protein
MSPSGSTRREEATHSPEGGERTARLLAREINFCFERIAQAAQSHGEEAPERLLPLRRAVVRLRAAMRLARFSAGKKPIKPLRKELAPLLEALDEAAAYATAAEALDELKSDHPYATLAVSQFSVWEREWRADTLFLARTLPLGEIVETARPAVDRIALAGRDEAVLPRLRRSLGQSLHQAFDEMRLESLLELPGRFATWAAGAALLSDSPPERRPVREAMCAARGAARLSTLRLRLDAFAESVRLRGRKRVQRLVRNAWREQCRAAEPLVRACIENG